MLWKINGVDLVVSNINETIPKFSAKINTLNSSRTIIHHFGYGSREVTFNGKVVGETKKGLLESSITLGNYITITGPNFSGNYYVTDYSIKRDLVISQSIDITEPCDSPVYSFTITGVEA